MTCFIDGSITDLFIRWLQGKNCSQPEFHVINKTTFSLQDLKKHFNPQKCLFKKMEECIPLIQCSIDQGSVSKSPLTKQKILDVYADIFEGLGTFLGEPYKFKLKENYACLHDMHKEKFHFYLQDDFHEEISDLIKQGVLEKVEHSTKWVNSFVIVEKDVSMDNGNAHALHVINSGRN